MRTVLRTEDTGKMFEMAICIAYGISYDGVYSYDMDLPHRLAPRLAKLAELFPQCKHTASRGSQYDFTSIADDTIHLSAKSTKRGGGRVAPQVIGQPTPAKLCDILGWQFTDNPTLKRDIQLHITDILPILTSNTFDCPIVFYNQTADTIRYIRLMTPIVWTSYEFQWTRNYDCWNNSSTLKIRNGTRFTPILEIQFHNASRTTMAIRWSFENFLQLFRENLIIIPL